eukprot:COSAG02_NODE_10653_length_1891_cov_1.151786_1_plen_359_part_10
MPAVNDMLGEPDRTIGSEHTISTEAQDEAQSPLSSPVVDTVLYCHFIPKKEFVEKGTPWIIHTPTKCHVCASVHFESMAMMRTAGPGGEAPDPIVCHCGVSRHHLRVEGYVTMTETDTAHPKATIRSHRPSLVNVPQIEKEISELKNNLKTSRKDALAATQKLTKERKDAAKVREKQNEYKRLAEQHREEVEKVQMHSAVAQRKLKDKEAQREEMARQFAALRAQTKDSSNTKRPHKENTAAKRKKSSGVDPELARLRTECENMRAQTVKAQSEGSALRAELQALQQVQVGIGEVAQLRAEVQGLREAAAATAKDQDALRARVPELQAQLMSESPQTGEAVTPRKGDSTRGKACSGSAS